MYEGVAHPYMEQRRASSWLPLDALPYLTRTLCLTTPVPYHLT